MKTALVIFARPPQAGKVKTRLAKTLGPTRAAAVYRVLLEEVLRQACATRMGVVLALTHDPVPGGWQPPPGTRWERQLGPFLSARMRAAFQRRWDEGFTKVLLIGSDVVGVRSEFLVQAALVLKGTPVVFGPARDGGYWLVGQHAPGWDLFSRIPTSKPSTLTQTLCRCCQLGLPFRRLATLGDVDTQEDLQLALADPHVPPGLKRRLLRACNAGNPGLTNLLEGAL